MKSRYIVIRDEHSKLFGHRFLNSQLSLYLGLIQLMVCIWALAQHVWSIFTFEKILHCDFSGNSTLPPLLTHVDAIIFDVGLFHHLWGITGCVAQHLDGGYGRFLWCIVHTAALLTCLPLAFVRRPKPQWLWPLLVQQSAYGVGMLILSLAALPKAAHMLGDIQNAPVQAIFFYTLGTLMNFFLLYVYWHWYWHVESLWNSARKMRRGETLTKSQRRPFRRVASSPAGVMGNFCQLQDNNDGDGGIRPITNGHIPAGEKKQLSVTLIDVNHHLTKVMPITRIEPSTSEDRNLAAKAIDAEKHHRVNSTKSLPNGHAHLKHRHYPKMPNGELKQHHRKRKVRKDGGNGNVDANSIGSNTSGSTATTTTTMAHAGKLDGLRPPPSPAPPAMSTDGLPAPAFQYSPEEALPPRVRHLRREEGRPKSPRKSSNSTVESSRKSSEGSTSSHESRKPSLEQNAATQQICHHQKIVEIQPNSALPPNGQLPPKHRQLSLRQRRRLSLRQRNQLAARKQHQQQQWAEKVGVAPLISRQSLPVMPVPVPVPLDGGNHNQCNGIYNFPPKYAQQMPPPQQFTTKILPSKQNFHEHCPHPNLQLASGGWTSIDHFVLPPNGHGNFGPYPPVCNGNGGMARTPAMANNRPPPQQHDFPKRPLDGPLNSLPLNFANGQIQRNCTPMLTGWTSDQLGTKFPHNDPPSPAKGLRV